MQSRMISTLLGKSRKAVGSSRKITGVSLCQRFGDHDLCRSPSERGVPCAGGEVLDPPWRSPSTICLSSFTQASKTGNGLRPMPISSRTDILRMSNLICQHHSHYSAKPLSLIVPYIADSSAISTRQARLESG